MVSLSTVKRPRARLRGRDFSSTSYRAPATVKRLTHAYNQPKNGSPWQLWRWILASAILITAPAALALSPLFSIRNIIVSGAPSHAIEEQLTQAVNQALTEKRWHLLPQSNLLFVSTARLTQAVNEQFTSHGVTFSRRWPNTLRVALPPNVLVALWQVGDESYLVDQQGALAQRLGDTPPPQLITVHEVNAPARTLGDTVAKPDLISALLQLAPAWGQQVGQPGLTYIEVDAANLPSLRVFTADGWYAYVSTENPLQAQLGALRELLQGKIQGDASKLEYVDVRFGSRLYYKLKAGS